MSTISNTEEEYERIDIYEKLMIRDKYEEEIEDLLGKTFLSRLWWMIGIKKGYLDSYNIIRNKYFKKMLK